ncbi:unnamed protein product, partial [Nesidiocoris tenuis]
MKVINEKDGGHHGLTSYGTRPKSCLTPAHLTASRRLGEKYRDLPKRRKCRQGAPLVPSPFSVLHTVSSSKTPEDLSTRLRPHTLDNFCEATRNHVAKCFPITSSESDLQKYRMSALWDPTASISNIHAESLRHKFDFDFDYEFEFLFHREFDFDFDYEFEFLFHQHKSIKIFDKDLLVLRADEDSDRPDFDLKSD